MTARRLVPGFLFVLLALVVAPLAHAQVSLTTLGVPYTQNFDTLPASGSGTWTNNSTIPGWFHARTGTGTTVVANDGTSNAGNLYSYGTGTNTDRALGSLGSGNAAIGNLFWGVRLQNNTGATITQLNVSYVGEQWRNSAAAAQTIAFSYLVGSPTVTGSLAEFQSAGVAVTALDFTSPVTGGTAGALVGNNAANRVSISFNITGLSIPNGTEIMLRWSDPDHTGADHGLSIDDFSVTPQGGVATPVLNINDVTLAEGNAGTTTFTFAVTLTAPAPVGGVTFDIATADGTAQDDNPATEDNDYVASSLTSQTIPAGSSGPYNFNVTVNGDTAVEPNETFFVNVTNIVGANAGDTQGLGTINNDDVSLTPIHDIQGPGSSSPIVGASVTTTGIVTGLKSNGFFLQEPDATVDADPATSEGVFVFTSAAPPVAAAVGNRVQVAATVVEFVPSSDTLQPPLTELSSPTVVLLSTGNPLPAAIPLTATFPDPAGPYDQLERLEGMRVSVASLTASSGTLGNSTNEPNATQTTNGVFSGVVTGVPRPSREPGIQAPDPAPSGGAIPPIPRFDANPELIRVDSDGLTGATAINLNTGAVVTGLVGPLDYGFRHYTILPDPTLPAPVVTGGMTATAVATATNKEFTVGSYNIERFFDTVNDPAISEPVLTAGAYDNRLNKLSLGIRNNLKMPDIIGFMEVENLTTLQDIAARINNDAVAAAQPNPQYVGFLSEGNDVGGIDVGFLVKTAPVTGATPRVTVNSVVQENKTELFTNPDTSTELLNDRPPLRLNATITSANGASYPVTVIAVHQRSLLGVNDESAGSNGWPTSGARVRAKRQAQAVSLANLVQAHQAENLILIGDFNAYEFNDGLADVMDTVYGTPPPDNQTAVPGDGADLVNPDLDNLFDTPPAGERYSYVFDGQMQNIDHAIVNAALTASTTARRIEHPRINTDFQAVDRNDPTTPRHLSDHDPLVGFYEVAAFATADLSITKTDNVDPVNAGQNFFYTLTVNNAGPDPADNVSWSDTLPAGTTFVSLSQPGGWSCTTPAVGGTGTVTCTNALLAVSSAAFNLTVAVNAGLASGTVLSNTATVTSTTADPDNTDLSATETTTVATSADLLISKTDTPDPVNAGSNISYTLTLTNNGPSNAASATFTDTLPAGTTFVSLSTTGPWSCTTPAVGASGTVTCTNASFGVTVDFFTLVVKVNPNVADGTVLSNTATLSSATTDPNSGNDSDTASTTVAASADLLLSKTDTPDPVTAGANISYQLTLTNSGPSNAASASLTDTLPVGTTFVSLSTTGPWVCSTPAVGATGTVTCTNPSFGVTVDFFTLVVKVDPNVADGTVLSNTATLASTTTDPNAGNNSDTATTTVAGLADLQLTKSDSPDPVTAGTNLTYTITLTNAGPSAAASVALADTVPPNTTFVSLAAPGGWSCTTPAVGGTGALNCSIASLPSGGNAVFTLIVNVGAGTADGTILSNTATATSTTTEAAPGNEAATATTTVGSGSADLSITKTDSPDPVVAGQNVTYTIAVTNAGPSSATTASMLDTLPAGTTFASLSAPAGWSCTTPPVGAIGTVNCTNASLGVTTATFTLVVNVNAATLGTVTNTATVSAATSDANSGNNSATSTTTVNTLADVQVTKSDSPDPISAGGLLTYNITVSNAGPSDAAAVSLTDTIPANTAYLGISTPAGWSCTTPPLGGTGTITCTIASLATTANAVFTVNVMVGPATPNGTIITNTANVSTTTPESTSENNSATTTSTVGAVTTFTATKSVSGSFVPGSTVTYTVVLTNNMGFTQADNPGLEFSDTLPSSLTLVSANATSGTATSNVGTNTVTWNGSIPNAASATITITATINAGAVGPVVNQGHALIDTDNSGQNETDLATDDPSTAQPNDPTMFTVQATAVVTGTKSVSGTYTPGSTVTYTVTLTNSGSNTQADNAGDEFTDVLPAEVTLVSASATSGTAVATTGTNTVRWNGAIVNGTSVTITITATVRADVPPGTMVSNQGTISYDSNQDSVNEATALTDDPVGPGSADPTVFVVIGAVQVTGTKSVSGTFTPGSTVTYTIVLTNGGNATQPDNIGSEFTDVLASQLTLVSASATSGTAVATTATNTVTWNGSIAAGASVTITINATVRPDAVVGSTVSNQGAISYDSDGNGTNESSAMTDSTSAPGSSDPTTFTVAPAAAVGAAGVPTLDEWALIALAALLAAFAVITMKR